jgi:hypothetical protein
MLRFTTDNVSVDRPAIFHPTLRNEPSWPFPDTLRMAYHGNANFADPFERVIYRRTATGKI